jgi:hypothetical protein
MKLDEVRKTSSSRIERYQDRPLMLVAILAIIIVLDARGPSKIPTIEGMGHIASFDLQPQKAGKFMVSGHSKRVSENLRQLIQLLSNVLEVDDKYAFLPVWPLTQLPDSSGKLGNIVNLSSLC